MWFLVHFMAVNYPEDQINKPKPAGTWWNQQDADERYGVNFLKDRNTMTCYSDCWKYMWNTVTRTHIHKFNKSNMGWLGAKISLHT